MKMQSPSHNRAEADQDCRLAIELVVWTLLLNIVISFSITSALQTLSIQLNTDIVGLPAGTAILGLSEVVLLMPLLVGRKRFKVDRNRLGLYYGTSTKTLGDLAIGSAIGLTMVPVSSIASYLNTLVLGPQPQSEQIKRAFTVVSPIEAIILALALILVVVPVEEVIARGYIQKGFQKSFGRPGGLIIASLFFSVMHLNLWSVFPVFLLGSMLGLCFQIRQERLLAPMTSHAVYMICLIASVSY